MSARRSAIDLSKRLACRLASTTAGPASLKTSVTNRYVASEVSQKYFASRRWSRYMVFKIFSFLQHFFSILQKTFLTGSSRLAFKYLKKKILEASVLLVVNPVNFIIDYKIDR